MSIRKGSDLPNGPWAEDGMVDRLRALYAEGLSMSEIGRRLGVGKNSIISKAHRLKLDPRPSPILPPRDPNAPRRDYHKRSHHGPYEQQPRAPRITLKPLISTAPDAATRQEPPVPAPTPHAHAAEAATGLVVPCRWPMWATGAKPTHEYCCASSLPGRIYCLEHGWVAWPNLRSALEPLIRAQINSAVIARLPQQEGVAA